MFEQSLHVQEMIKYFGHYIRRHHPYVNEMTMAAHIHNLKEFTITGALRLEKNT